MEKEKNLELDRLVFFSDAVVAIAITLLALDLRLDKNIDGPHLTFNDILQLWPEFSSFFLSFPLIAVFWKVHHQFFFFIKKIDGFVLWINIFWLLFIVVLPFSTTVVSDYFGQKVSVLVYSINILLITTAQNIIWDYVSVRPDYLNERITNDVIRNYRFMCNIAMINAVLAIGLSFIFPTAAFCVLFIRTITTSSFTSILRRGKKKESGKR